MNRAEQEDRARPDGSQRCLCLRYRWCIAACRSLLPYRPRGDRAAWRGRRPTEQPRVPAAARPRRGRFGVLWENWLKTLVCGIPYWLSIFT